MPWTLVSQNAQYGALAYGRSVGGLVNVFRDVDPAVVLLQESDWLADADRAREAEEALGMRLLVAPSRNLNTAVAWDPDRLSLIDCETKYWQDLHHGYCAPRFDVGLAAPLVLRSSGSQVSL
jgi:hypothetical protein